MTNDEFAHILRKLEEFEKTFVRINMIHEDLEKRVKKLEAAERGRDIIQGLKG